MNGSFCKLLCWQIITITLEMEMCGISSILQGWCRISVALLVAYSLFIWTFYSPHQQFYLTLPSCFSLPRDFAQSGLTSFFWSPFSADCVSLRIHEHHLNARRQWPFVSSPLKWQPCQKCVLASLQVTSEAHICLAFLPLQDFVNPINSFFLPYIFKRFLWWCSIPS